MLVKDNKEYRRELRKIRSWITIPLKESFESIETILKPIIIEEFYSIRSSLNYRFKLFLADSKGNITFSGISSGIYCCENCYSCRYKFNCFTHQFNAPKRTIEFTANRVKANDNKKHLKFGDFNIPILYNN